MRLAEFKAWFEGYTENIEAAPTEKQWGRIKEMVGKVDGTPVTPTVIRDYIPYPSQPFWQRPWYSTCDASPPTAIGIGKVSFSTAHDRAVDKAYWLSKNQTVEFDAMEAMRDLGRTEASA